MRLGKENNQYVIGVDGGGTAISIAIANLNGKVLFINKEKGSSNIRNIGIEKSAENITKGIIKTLKLFSRKQSKFKKENILSFFIGIPSYAEGSEERKKEIKEEIIRNIVKNIPEAANSKIEVESDQIVAFRAGTNQRDGIVLISGTGCVSRGWKKDKEAKSSGWGYLTDEGSGFWVGQKVLQAVLKDLDGRGLKTFLTKTVLEKAGANSCEGLTEKIYRGNIIELISSFSILCDKESQRDKVAKSILKNAGEEAGLALITVINKLHFQNREFPIVLSGGMFKSKIFLETVKKIIKEEASLAKIILLKDKPVSGAVNLAIEQIKK